MPATNGFCCFQRRILRGFVACIQCSARCKTGMHDQPRAIACQARVFRAPNSRLRPLDVWLAIPSTGSKGFDGLGRPARGCLQAKPRLGRSLLAVGKPRGRKEASGMGGKPKLECDPQTILLPNPITTHDEWGEAQIDLVPRA